MPSMLVKQDENSKDLPYNAAVQGDYLAMYLDVNNYRLYLR